jgi:tetratricopeptide (TPR) repeat protein
VIEDTMFFPRLRRQAKWVFLFLAIVFALGFVGFGVGAGGIGLGNVFEGVADSGVASVSDAEKRVQDNPRDPAAFRELATAHQAANDTQGAIEALENLVALRPKNTEALRELAGLYLVQAGDAQQRANEANTRAAYIAPGASVAGLTLIDGRPLDPNAISSAVSQELSSGVQVALGEAQQASTNAVATYKKLAAAEPRDPATQFILGQTAQDAGDSATAIAAYKKFLVLAPDDPTAPDVRRLLKQLQSTQPSG